MIPFFIAVATSLITFLLALPLPKVHNLLGKFIPDQKENDNLSINQEVVTSDTPVTQSEEDTYLIEDATQHPDSNKSSGCFDSIKNSPYYIVLVGSILSFKYDILHFSKLKSQI